MKDRKEIAQTLTAQDGDFRFPSVPSGNYFLKASHPKYGFCARHQTSTLVFRYCGVASYPCLFCARWHVSSAEVPVSVFEGNGYIKPGSLAVLGYDVSGRVLSDGEPVRGVNFILFQQGVPEVCFLYAMYI